MELQEYEQEHLSTLRHLLPECTVLLKNDGFFPLNKPCKLALYGSGARKTVKGGTGSGEVNSRFSETIESGLVNAGFKITSGDWLDGYDIQIQKAKKNFKNFLKKKAKEQHSQIILIGMGMAMPEPDYELPMNAEGDIAVYVLSRKSGEGQDRQILKGDIYLTDTEIRDILACNEKYPRFMLVLNVGGPVDLSPVMQVKNILVLSQLGCLNGTALSDILLGKENPSGKLTTTWSAWKDYPGLIDFGDLDDTRYREGIYVGYRYFQSVGSKPLFPFGYGCSYTTFALTCSGVTLANEIVTVQASITNTGTRSGKEVAQLYVSKPFGTLDQPERELAAFAKSKLLLPGETEILQLSFSLPEIASYSEQNEAYLLEQGNYLLRLGNSSSNTATCGVIQLPESIITRRVHNCLEKTDFKDFCPSKDIREEIDEKIPILTVDPAKLSCETVSYDTAIDIPECVKSLSDEDIIKTCIGSFNPKGGFMSIIGNASQKIAGAAGQTASIPSMHELVMADGPAGLRLSKDYYIDSSGAHGMEQSIPKSILELMGPGLRILTKITSPKPKKNVEILHQYCTMIPIGTAIAQSWNTELAQQCGDIVGDEMERFDIQLWLAPAMNIHRSILCGRNFEYFSEDPYISGKIAAAITKGVQSHKGRGVTIKHFAANNQENNRYASNSIVSERAMREIYLKGFELCIREAAPAALMSSYNLLNGIHTAERGKLMTDILRCEFGFHGILMTDWLTGMNAMARGKHSVAKVANIIAAGTTLIMPGCKDDYDNLLSALHNGTITRRQLEVSAATLLFCGNKLTI